ncbi:uncharacterized protein PG986_011175 [Apiospora aurea]|uniref:Uncharacterized protein n=1 Tax=Apiospora aurea TaxID=335848 RepID=A0ABR1Q525_9PEZI
MELNRHRAFKSPDPGISRFCLGMAAIAFTAILMARHRRDQTFEPRVPKEEYAFFWAKLLGAFAQAALLVIHGDLLPFEPFGRWVRYEQKHGGNFYRASPLCAGVVGVCAVLLYNVVFGGQDFPQ